ncbi:MAG: LysR family transcriptional regulator [Steroidobacteraceae bacterium]
MLNFRQIEVFRAIMLTRTMSAAAEMLNASQPGLSRMIRNLEGRLGFLLFDRVRGRLQPTAEANALFLEIEHIHHSIGNLDHIVARLGAGENLVFRLGASPSLGRGFVPELLRNLQQTHPRLVIQFDILSVEQVTDYLVVGRSEYALTVYAIDHPNLVSTRIGATPLVAVLPAGHPLLARVPLAIGDLVGERVISFAPDTPHGRAIAEMSLRANVKLRVSTRVRFAETACAFVARGLGVSIVDEQTARDSGFVGIVRVPLRNASEMPIYLHRSRSAPRSKVSATFERLCRREGAAILESKNR